MQDGNVWLTQKAIGQLFDVERSDNCHISMTMADWAGKLDAFLKFNDAEILQDKRRVTTEIAKAFAENEFEQYRVMQDENYFM